MSSNPAGAEANLKTGVHLETESDGVSLVSGDVELREDFSSMLHRLRYDNLTHEMLVRASRFRNVPAGTRLRAVDATAGLGEDSLLLAASGFEVQMYEHNPVTAALLRDALDRASQLPELADIISRMHLHEADSISALRNIGEHEDERPDLVFQDPMFPERQKNSMVKKKLQLLQQIEIPCSDEEELLKAAISAGPRRIVIKRPVKGPYLAGRKPSYSIKGSVIRYDCIVLRA